MPDRPLVRRRTAVLGLAATVLATGCDHGDDIGGPAPSTSPSSTTPSPSAPEQMPDQTPDETLVDTTVEQLDAAYGVVMAARRLRPLRQPLAPLAKAHRRHLEALEAGREGGPLPVPAGPAAALQAVHRSERQLQALLVDAAGRAESGALAKLLASMSASVTQFLATLPAEVPS